MNFRAHFIIWNGPKKYENFQKKIKNTSWNWKSNMKMVLESLEPKVNDKILKKIFFQNFGGFRAPPKPPFLGFWWVLGELETPQNFEKIFFSKFYHFLWALNFPEPSSYLIFNFRKYFYFFWRLATWNFDIVVF